MADNLVERVRKIITRYSMLTAGDRVGIAVSGGADSVVLLHVLHDLISEFALHLTVLHVNHGLRGAESDADEDFVRELAASLGLPFISARAMPEPGNLEQEARRLRRQCFSMWRTTLGLEKIALGHTSSDQAETVLYRFLRGSGLAGLAGMRPVTADGIIRPLLCVSRADVRVWAEKGGLHWREDSSNADHSFARNLLRNQVLPELAQQFNPNLEGILAGTAEIAGAEEDYWQGQIGPLYHSLAKRCELGVLISVKDLNSEHVAIQRRLIREGINEIRGDLRSIDQQHVESVLHVCSSTHGHDRVIIPGVDAMRSFGLLLLTKPGELSAEPRNYSVDLAWNEKVTLPFGVGEIELELLNDDDINCVNFNKETQFPAEIADLDIQALSSPAVRLQIRNWRPGDSLVRAGHQKPEKIKSLFQEFQVLLWERRHWPVAVANDDVFWVRRFGAASAYAAKGGSSKIARLSYSPGR